MENATRYKNWYDSALDDYEWAVGSFKDSKFSQCCFICQQVGEKAIKSLAMYKGAQIIKGHSISKLASMLKINGEIENAGKKLDLYYISARYPDAFPEGIPSDYFTKDQAEEALNLAQKILDKIKSLISL